MTVHFVASGKVPDKFRNEPSFLYRCENLAHSMGLLGIKTILQHISEFSIEKDTTHVIFHRPRYSTRFKRIVKQLKTKHITIIADFDDLLFDEDYLEFSPAILNSILPTSKVRQAYRAHYQALNYVDHLTTSTDCLARYARACFSHLQVKVHKNNLHHSWPLKPFKSADHRKKVLTYFPGTRSHDRDFWQIEDVLRQHLSDNKNTELLVIGPLRSNLLKSKHNQISHKERLSFEEYREAVSNSYVNLLPLEPTPFNQCKSAIKVIEAGNYAIPTICSALPDASRFRGIGASIAIDSDQWLESLEFLSNYEHYQKALTQIRRSFHKAADPSPACDSFIEHYQIQTR